MTIPLFLAQGGGVIWDFSGNVWEHVNKVNTIDGTGFNSGQTAVAGSSAPTVWDDNGIYTSTDMQKYAAATGPGTAGGMGNLYYAQGVASNIILRGGSADFSSNTGIFTLNLAHTAGLKIRNLAFRCAK